MGRKSNHACMPISITPHFKDFGLLGTAANTNLLPLGIGLIAAYAKSVPAIRDDYNIELRFIRHRYSDLIKTLEQPKVVGFACYVWNLHASLRLIPS